MHKVLRSVGAAMVVLGLAAGVALNTSVAMAAEPDDPAVAASSVGVFPQEVRYLEGLWANEFVPGYECPSDMPYLVNKNYAPIGTSLIPGVEIRQEYEPWPIGVSITAMGHEMNKWVRGIVSSHTSTTNWTFGKQWYQVVLHCTSDVNLGYMYRTSHPGVG